MARRALGLALGACAVVRSAQGDLTVERPGLLQQLDVPGGDALREGLEATILQKAIHERRGSAHAAGPEAEAPAAAGSAWLGWTDADWQRALWCLQGPATRVEEEAREHSTLQARVKALDRDVLPFEDAIAGPLAGLPVAEACRSAASKRCKPGLVALRLLARVAGYNASAESWFRDLGELGDIFQEEIAPPLSRLAPRLHWGQGDWIHKAVYAVALQLAVEEWRKDMLAAAEADRAKKQFSFGKNWFRMVSDGTWDQSAAGSKALRKAVNQTSYHLFSFLGLPRLDGLSVLDLGCGTGLHSLSMLLRGASRVLSVDIDENSLKATLLLRDYASDFLPEGARWDVERLDILDRPSLGPLQGLFDVVYSYGVLHHTGDVYGAVENALGLLHPQRGIFYLALYPLEGSVNRQAYIDRVIAYHASAPERKLVFDAEQAFCVLLVHTAYGGDIGEYLRWQHRDMRGMDFMTDMRDTLGGWPVDFVDTRRVIDLVHDRGLEVFKVGTHGNVEFLIWQGQKASRDSALAPLVRQRECSQVVGEWELVVNSGVEQEGCGPWGAAWMRWGWKIRAPPWARAIADTSERPYQGRRVLLLEDGRLHGFPSALSKDSVLAANTSAFAVFNGHIFMFPAVNKPGAPQPGTKEDHARVKRTRYDLCKVMHWH